MSTSLTNAANANWLAWLSAHSHLIWASGVAAVMLTALVAGASESNERYDLDTRLHQAAKVIDNGVGNVQQFFPGSFR